MSKKKNRASKFALLPRLMAWSFVGLAVAQMVATVGMVTAPEMVAAKDTFDAQVKIGSEAIEFDGSTRPIAMYIKSIYTYAVGAVGILATVMLMIGGLRWIVAGGNPSSISEAKSIILASISGMVLVMTSWIILRQINPALVDLKQNIIKVETITGKEASSEVCTWTEVSKTLENENDPNNSDFYYRCQNGQTEKSDACNPDSKLEPKDSNNLILCCCSSKPSECLKDEKIECTECKDCVELTVPCGNPKSCKANKALAKKLNDAYFPGWQVTEAWPPTVHHYAHCQADGTCIDVGFTNNNPYDKARVTAFINVFKEANLKPVFECLGTGCCGKVGLNTTEGNCLEFTSHITANHFSVYNN